MKKETVIILVSVSILACVVVLFVGAWNGAILRSAKQEQIESALKAEGVNLVSATIYESSNIIVHLDETSFLEQAKGQTVYESSQIRFIFYSNDKTVQYEYDIGIWWSLEF